MKLKHRWDFRVVFTGLYFVCFAVYLIFSFRIASAVDYEISTVLLIPDIGLKSGVTELELYDGKLNTPDAIVGSFSKTKNKTLLIGHSSTVFGDLEEVDNGSEIVYNNNIYYVVGFEVLAKADIDMNKLLSEAERDTLVIMTCAGESLGDKDATHRLILTAVQK